MNDDSRRYEVVIHAGDGIEKEHAELLRDRLVGQGYHEHVVSIRPTFEHTDALAESIAEAVSPETVDALVSELIVEANLSGECGRV